jgi:hypothetical protein
VTAWFAARNRLDEYEMHRLLFDHPVVRRDLSALKIPSQQERVPGGLTEIPGGALKLDGILATIIVQGGAYQAFSGQRLRQSNWQMKRPQTLPGEGTRTSDST